MASKAVKALLDATPKPTQATKHSAPAPAAAGCFLGKHKKGTTVVPGKRKWVQQNMMEKVLEALRAPIVLPEPKENDPDLQFLESLLPDFKEIYPLKKTAVLIKILDVIENAKLHNQSQ